MDILRRLPPLFLLGLLPVVCVLGLWADSLTHRLVWSRCRVPGRDSLVVSEYSRIHFWRTLALEGEPGAVAAYGSAGLTGPGGYLQHDALPPAPGGIFGQPLFPPVDLGEASFGSSSHLRITRWQLAIPYWLILFCYLPAWCFLGLWQADRRRKRSAG